MRRNYTLVGVITNKPPCLFTTCLKVVGDNTNNGKKFNEAGVEIMSPSFTSIRDGNSIQIPEAHKPVGYKASGFGINKDK